MMPTLVPARDVLRSPLTSEGRSAHGRCTYIPDQVQHTEILVTIDYLPSSAPVCLHPCLSSLTKSPCVPRRCLWKGVAGGEFNKCCCAALGPDKHADTAKFSCLPTHSSKLSLVGSNSRYSRNKLLVYDSTKWLMTAGCGLVTSNVTKLAAEGRVPPARRADPCHFGPSTSHSLAFAEDHRHIVCSIPSRPFPVQTTACSGRFMACLYTKVMCVPIRSPAPQIQRSIVQYFSWALSAFMLDAHAHNNTIEASTRCGQHRNFQKKNQIIFVRRGSGT
ncbi:hypothetical protein JB92DRAFT_962489 [Gautieria morchelliformis]|nr:hypothetical protein JB92DRAFT_962489 [Gautieria morchelliformis]